MRITHSASLVFRLSFCLLFALSTLGIAIKGATSFSSPRKRLGKYRENTNRYHTEIPNRDTTLEITALEP
jgi:hypothetical protein